MFKRAFNGGCQRKAPTVRQLPCHWRRPPLTRIPCTWQNDAKCGKYSTYNNTALKSEVCGAMLGKLRYSPCHGLPALASWWIAACLEASWKHEMQGLRAFANVCTVVDFVLSWSGGLWRGEVVEIYGAPGTGMSGLTCTGRVILRSSHRCTCFRGMCLNVVWSKAIGLKGLRMSSVFSPESSWSRGKTQLGLFLAASTAASTGAAVHYITNKALQ